MSLSHIFITNRPEIALIAEEHGVDRIMVDLETLGKEERQKNMNTVKSHHSISDVGEIAKVLTSATLLVRVNPWNPGSRSEIEDAIRAGATELMLPMWKTPQEVEAFLQAVDGRVPTILLLETREAAECVETVLEKCPPDRIHIGLNDLHLSYGLNFLFETLAVGIVDRLAETLRRYPVPFGFGGVARVGEGMLPAEAILKEHHRLGSSAVILSRAFCNVDSFENLQAVRAVFAEHMPKILAFENSLSRFGAEELMENHRFVCECVSKIVQKIKENR